MLTGSGGPRRAKRLIKAVCTSFVDLFGQTEFALAGFLCPALNHGCYLRVLPDVLAVARAGQRHDCTPLTGDQPRQEAYGRRRSIDKIRLPRSSIAIQVAAYKKLFMAHWVFRNDTVV